MKKYHLVSFSIFLILIIFMPMVKSALTDGLISCNNYDNFNGSDFLPDYGGYHLYGNITNNLFHVVSYSGNNNAFNFTAVKNSSEWNLTQDYTISFNYILYGVSSAAPTLIESVNESIKCGFNVISGLSAGFVLQAFNSTGTKVTLRFGLANGGSGVGRPVDFVWHHFLYTYNSTDGNHTFYIDDLQRNSSALIMDCSEANDFFVGHNKFGSAGTGILNGQIDDFMYWNRMLNTSELVGVNGTICKTPVVCATCPSTEKTLGINLFSDFEQYSEDTLLSYNGDSILSKRRTKCENG